MLGVYRGFSNRAVEDRRKSAERDTEREREREREREGDFWEKLWQAKLKLKCVQRVVVSG